MGTQPERREMGARQAEGLQTVQAKGGRTGCAGNWRLRQGDGRGRAAQKPRCFLRAQQPSDASATDVRALPCPLFLPMMAPEPATSRNGSADVARVTENKMICKDGW
jgi:hypothetical protein